MQPVTPEPNMQSLVQPATPEPTTPESTYQDDATWKIGVQRLGKLIFSSTPAQLAV